ncbi:MAG: bi-domain-containing oxidoreductase [Fibrobacterota bacterium]|nr:bi-domain-containing oxidoreductase [Chitinispirillaceae bacterium]
MKQLFQNLKTGKTELVDCPFPQCKKGSLVIQTRASLISLGTEKMLVEFSKSSLIDKARQQPEKVKQTLDKVKSDGIIATFQAVSAKLDEPLPLGYCNAGVVLDTGDGVSGFGIGDRVISNGPHAEVVSVSKNLVSKIPDNVTFEEAAFTVAGSIGLQGVRLASPTLGETAVVIGLGLIGQLTAQLAKANGSRVIAFDLDNNKIALAKTFGIEAMSCSDPVQPVLEQTGGVGADYVIITASSASEQILSQAARMSRKRGRIILVGVIPLHINRSEFYEKELSFQVSCSYGPGRYDPAYESAGNDYPLPFVRWTEQRNFDAVLQCIANGPLNVKPLITNRILFANAPETYDALGQAHSIATIIKYPENGIDKEQKTLQIVPTGNVNTTGGELAIIGSGNFTKATLLPALKKNGTQVKYICSQTGVYGPYLAKRFGIPYCTTDTEKILSDDSVKSVIITTRHSSHTNLSLKALEKGKHVFLEKPLAVNREQLAQIETFFSKERDVSLTVGFNRRYSPLVDSIKNVLGETPSQMNVVYTMNAGFIPSNHWLQTASEGGRIIGEACHCIDLFSYLCGSPVVSVCASSLGTETDLLSDNVSIVLKSKNGSNGVINYFANGNKQYPKENVQVFYNGNVIELSNFRNLKVYGKKSFSKNTLTVNKGHSEQFRCYAQFLKGNGKLKNSIQEHINVTEASIAAVESLLKKSWVDVSCVW